MSGLRVGVVGSGISGLAAAHYLARRHRVTLFESESRLGGHTHTHDVVIGGRALRVDTGFIVYNHRTYPSFVRLLAELGVRGRKSDMSFGAHLKSEEEWDGVVATNLSPPTRPCEPPRAR